MTNYRVAGGFGNYKVGAVLLRAHVEPGNSLDELVARGVLVPTDAPHTEELRPKKKPAIGETLPLIEDVNRMRGENAALREERDAITLELATVKGLLAKAESTVKAREEQLGAMAGEHRDELAHWKAVAADKDKGMEAAERKAAGLETQFRAARAEIAAMTAPESKTDKKAAK